MAGDAHARIVDAELAAERGRFRRRAVTRTETRGVPGSPDELAGLLRMTARARDRCRAARHDRAIVDAVIEALGLVGGCDSRERDDDQQGAHYSTPSIIS